MKRVLYVTLLVCVIGSLPLIAEDVLDRPVAKSTLSGAYQRHSDAASNKQWTIVEAHGTADNAVESIIARGDDRFRIKGVDQSATGGVYDAVTGGSYDRVIYDAEEILRPRPPSTMKVAIDYENVSAEKLYRAYAAEVKQGVCRGCGSGTKTVSVDTPRWEFKKSGRN